MFLLSSISLVLQIGEGGSELTKSSHVSSVRNEFFEDESWVSWFL
jgi:hypothetical protein